MISKYWKKYINSGYLTAAEAQRLSCRSINLRGCCLWLAHADKYGNPLLYDSTVKNYKQVRHYLASKILNRKAKFISTSCGRKDCIHVNHMVLWTNKTKITDVNSVKLLKKLVDQYPLAYLHRYYGLSTELLRRIKYNDIGLLNESI